MSSADFECLPKLSKRTESSHAEFGAVIRERDRGECIIPAGSETAGGLNKAFVPRPTTSLPLFTVGPTTALLPLVLNCPSTLSWWACTLLTDCWHWGRSQNGGRSDPKARSPFKLIHNKPCQRNDSGQWLDMYMHNRHFIKKSVSRIGDCSWDVWRVMRIMQECMRVDMHVTWNHTSFT